MSVERGAGLGGNVLVVDDEASFRRLLRDLLTLHGFQVHEAGSGEDALSILAERSMDVVLLDLNMDGMSGHEVLTWIRADKATAFIPVVMITGGATTEEKLRALEEGVTDFLAKPFKTEELLARVRSSIQMKRATDALEDAENVIIALAKVIDARDPYTCFHSDRVSWYAGHLGEAIGLRGKELDAVRKGGLFHDLGKVAVPDGVLLKPGRLTPEEMAQMKRHPVEGRRLLVGMKSLSYALDVVYHHHEKCDGSGYPCGLSGDEIPLVARVTTIADIYDALTTARVYRAALSPEEALGIMKSEAAKGWWDVRLLEAFRGVLSKVPDSLAPESLGRIRT